MVATSRRFSLALALAIPTMAVVLCSTLHAQFPPKPPIGPGPIVPPPGFPQMPNPPGFQPFPNQPGLNPPNMPGALNPPFNQPNFGGPKFPKIENVWICNKCNREIGRGAFPPGTCPHCGVRIINGIGGGGNPNPGMPGGPNLGGPNPGIIPPGAMPPGMNPPFNPPIPQGPPVQPPEIQFPEIPAPVIAPPFVENLPELPPPVMPAPAPANESNVALYVILALLSAAFVIVIITLVALKASGAF